MTGPLAQAAQGITDPKPPGLNIQRLVDAANGVDPLQVPDGMSKLQAAALRLEETATNRLVHQTLQALEPPEPPGPGFLGILVDETVKMAGDMAMAADLGLQTFGELALSKTVPGLFPENTDPTKRISTQDFRETTGEFLVRRASEGDPEAIERVNRITRGAAFLAALLPAGRVAARAVLGRQGANAFTRSVLGFAATEGVAGSIYGSIAPLEGDESRLRSIGRNTLEFAGFGAGFAVLGKAFKGAWRKMSKADQEEAAARAADNIDGSEHQVNKDAQSVDDPAFEFQAAKKAAEDVDPTFAKRMEDELLDIGDDLGALPADESIPLTRFDDMELRPTEFLDELLDDYRSPPSPRRGRSLRAAPELWRAHPGKRGWGEGGLGSGA